MKFFIKLYLLLLVFCFGLNCNANNKKVLIVIGYADDSEVNGLETVLFKPIFHDLAFLTLKNIQKKIFDLGYRSLEEGRYIDAKNNLIHIENANTLCGNESLFSVAKRFKICERQEKKSADIVNILKTSMSNYDELIYIGHSRKGLGLGLGPFEPEYTFKPEFFNNIEKGQLKKISLFSCSSKLYYGYLSKDFLFLGFSDDMMWKDLLNNLTNYLQKSLSNPDFL